jgi:ATP-dependent Zn protease
LEILALYLSKIKHDASVDIDKLAKMTVGFSGADLENMVNTAAIRAAVDGKTFITGEAQSLTVTSTVSFRQRMGHNV